jgi:hypothetical protein
MARALWGKASLTAIQGDERAAEGAATVNGDLRPRHIGHVLEWVRTIASLFAVGLQIAIAFKVFGLLGCEPREDRFLVQRAPLSSLSLNLRAFFGNSFWACRLTTSGTSSLPMP